MAQQPGQKTFSSQKTPATRWSRQRRNNDEKAMLEILGPDGKQIVSSGDEAEDAESRAKFRKAISGMHRLVQERIERTVCTLAKEWPTPIPLVNKGNSWDFDTGAGRRNFVPDELAGMKYRPSGLSRNSCGAKGIPIPLRHNEYGAEDLQR